jgi:hypothetical protein
MALSELSTSITWARKLFFESSQNVLAAVTPISAHLSAKAPKVALPTEAGWMVNNNEENLLPLVLTADDLDPTNTRLFVKSLSPELHDYSFLYRLFRSFGKIRMLALNTKRHNALVEYERKVRSLAGRRRATFFVSFFGRVFFLSRVTDS